MLRDSTIPYKSRVPSVYPPIILQCSLSAQGYIRRIIVTLISIPVTTPTLQSGIKSASTALSVSVSHSLQDGMRTVVPVRSDKRRTVTDFVRDV